MFRNASGLTSLDLSNFDTSNVTNMSHMFVGTSNLRELTLGENFEFKEAMPPISFSPFLPAIIRTPEFTGSW